MVTAVILNWNTNAIATKSAYRLVKDVDVVIIVDNGSQEEIRVPRALNITNPENVGNCIARNQGLDLATGHVLMLDGDVLYVPKSVELLKQGLDKWPEAGCVGFDGSIRTKGPGDYRADVDQDVEDLIVAKPEEQRIAWTQYGLFRDKVADIIRFDETGYFGGPGYGFEDNDYYEQMRHAGWHSYSITGIKYHHRDGSSKPQLANAYYRERYDQFRSKWKGVE